jgi:hypothetical protein
MFVVDVDMASLIGEDYPKLVRQPGRKLQAKRHSSRKAYNRSLHKNIRRHKLIEKYQSLQSNHSSLSEEDKQIAINKLDRQKTEFMKCGESGCRKICKGKLDFSPQVAMCERRRRVFKWILKHKQSPLKDPRNLYRACRTLSKPGGAYIVLHPNKYSEEQVRAHLIAIEEHMKSLRLQAPELRQQHLRDCEKIAEANGNTKKAKEIRNIIERGRVCHRYEEVNKTNRVRKGGGSVFKVEKRELDGTTTILDNKEAIEAVAGQTIGERYRLAYSAPIMSNPTLLKDVGFGGDGEAIESILRGTYDFPEGTDQYTKLLLLEAAILFTSLGEDTIIDFIQRSDFQSFWRTAREKNRIFSVWVPLRPLCHSLI